MNFVRIEHVFTEKTTRTIEMLSKVYTNKVLLSEKIRSISKEIINCESIHDKKIFLKPNWVLQNRNEDDDICLRTNDNFLLVVLEIILETL